MTLCPICSNDTTTLVTNEVRFGNRADVLQCERCSLVFLDQKSFQFPEDFYETQYHQTYLTHVEPDALDPHKYYEKMLQTVRPWSDRINAMLTGTEVILDVGCSTGHLITSIRDKAAQVYGHEISRKEVEFCRNELGLDVDDKPLETRFAEGTFDYITMIFVLEHIAEPVEFLTYLKKFLKPGGQFIILVPNVQDALVNFYDIPAFRQFYYCIEHLFYYSPKTISDMFARAGLSGAVGTVQEYPVTNHLNWGYRQRPSDVLAARRVVPDIPLRNPEQMEPWEEFWKHIDQQYKQFLQTQGFADRIWCVVGANND